MADLKIEFEDGPRKGESLVLRNTWEYPARIRVAATINDITGFVYYAKGERKERDGRRASTPAYFYDAAGGDVRTSGGTKVG